MGRRSLEALAVLAGAAVLFFLGCSSRGPVRSPIAVGARAPALLVPWPNQLEWTGQSCTLVSGATIYVDAAGVPSVIAGGATPGADAGGALHQLAHELAARLDRVGFATSVRAAPRGVAIASSEQDRAWIELRLAATEDLGAEGYRLDVERNRVLVQASAPAGLFYGVQTLVQLMPVEVFGPAGKAHVAKIVVPGVRILDRPRYPWRGFMLDCGRHFFPKEHVLEILARMAEHKLNRFHWHLTEDQGWRLAIGRYPRLTDVGAWRDENGVRYGGYYTQDDVREIVAFAAARHITIVPEIEMPGHCTAALAAYPELSCTGGPFAVATQWGVLSDVFCAGNERTFEFLEGVLDEVMALFPSPWIHIGGDEVPKTRWLACPRCKARMVAEGLASGEELQSYFIRRIARYLGDHGRRLIGWDEILEGGLAPDAVVMSWRGTEGGEAAAQQGHDVVMTPESHCYLNRDQGRPEQEPTAVGGYLPLEKVYAFEPTPTGLAAERARHILGLQGNLWTERVTSPERVEYMVFPRLAAIAEVGWTASRDWERFASGLGRLFERFERQGVHAARSAYAVGMTVTPTATGAIEVRMTSAWPDATLRYTVDSKEPGARAARYRRPLLFSRSATVKAALFDGGKRVSGVTTQTLWFHAGVGRPIVAVHQPSAKYRELAGLVDGLRGSQFLGDGRWVGFEGPDMVVTVDLGRERALRRVSIGLLQNTTSWIFFPRRVELELSADGSVFHATGDTVELGPATLDPVVTVRLADVAVPAGTSARYVRVRAESVGVCPSGHPGEGQPAWVFADELVIE